MRNRLLLLSVAAFLAVSTVQAAGGSIAGKPVGPETRLENVIRALNAGEAVPETELAWAKTYLGSQRDAVGRIADLDELAAFVDEKVERLTALCQEPPGGSYRDMAHAHCDELNEKYGADFKTPGAESRKASNSLRILAGYAGERGPAGLVRWTREKVERLTALCQEPPGGSYRDMAHAHCDELKEKFGVDFKAPEAPAAQVANFRVLLGVYGKQRTARHEAWAGKIESAFSY